ncbi:MAG: imidazoleglycerol-phosphate dehydratase HisB [Saccharofermentanales bacterium]|jgi:imidazoleglycerol-phosphate dehydratase|nr:imidazoleglycerol-phosphate dehydratase HisB [Clostridiaceae bacterium]
MRQSTINRKTQETEITVTVTFDGQGRSSVDTGIGFLDHMLTLLARHAGLDLEIKAVGDLHVDGHHTVEDIGIILGQAISDALGEKRGIRRYGQATLPMDEALLSSVLDLSGRPFFVFNARFDHGMVGGFDTQLTEEFFRAVAFNAGMTLHLICHYGNNDHHKIEGLFKAFAHSLACAASIDPSLAGEVLSTKGVL